MCSEPPLQLYKSYFLDPVNPATDTATAGGCGKPGQGGVAKTLPRLCIFKVDPAGFSMGIKALRSKLKHSRMKRLQSTA